MLSLVADYDTSSSSSEEDGSTDNEDSKEKHSEINASSSLAKPSPTFLLPSANFVLSKGSSKPTGDVFNNPFLEAEKLEIDKLQKHVKMVDTENHLLQKNGRKICWNNRKSRCRFGNKCKYAHESDLVEAKEIPDVDKKSLNTEIKIPATKIPPYSFEIATVGAEVLNESTSKVKTRKRPGLGDSIVPGKQVMKTYHSIKKSTL